jgi:phage/plasmid-like protein (TIGR03299 family)
MAAGINESDYMMYVNQDGMPWHKIGKGLPNIATMDEALEAARLNWTVEKQAIMSRQGKMHSNRMMVVRQDTGTILGIVGYGYIPFQNRQSFQLMEEIMMDPGGPKISTAGSLHNGEIVWGLFTIPEFIKVTSKDIVKTYMLLTNSHNGKYRVRIKQVNTRVVCANTMGQAFNEKSRGISFKHIGDIDTKVSDVRKALGIVIENQKTLNQLITEMTKVSYNDETAKALIEQCYPGDEPEILNTRAKVLHLFDNGKGNDESSLKGSAWYLYNAVTEMEDHYIKDSPSTRKQQESQFNRILLDTKSSPKDRMLELISKDLK